MNTVELCRALRQLRLGGMASVLETRLLEAQTDNTPYLDFLSTLVQDELVRRQDRLLERRIKKARFRDRGKTLDNFDFDFNKKMDRRLVFELATGRFVDECEDALFLGPPGTGKSHLAQAIGLAVIHQGVTDQPVASGGSGPGELGGRAPVPGQEFVEGARGVVLHPEEQVLNVLVGVHAV